MTKIKKDNLIMCFRRPSPPPLPEPEPVDSAIEQTAEKLLLVTREHLLLKKKSTNYTNHRQKKTWYKIITNTFIS